MVATLCFPDTLLNLLTPVVKHLLPGSVIQVMP